MKLKSLKPAPLIIASVVIGVVCLIRYLSQPNILPKLDTFLRMEWNTFDWRVRGAANRSGTNEFRVGFITIDDYTLPWVNTNQQYGFAYPWPRQIYGRVVNELKAQGVKAIGFDILYPETRPDIESERIDLPGRGKINSDLYFAEQMRAAGNVILAITGEGTNMVTPTPLFTSNTWKLGAVDADKDSDGIFRRIFPYRLGADGNRVWNMGIVLAALELGLDLDRSETRGNNIILPGTNGTSRTIELLPDGTFYLNWIFDCKDRRLKQRNLLEVLEDADSRKAGQPAETGLSNKLVVVASIGSGNNIADIGATPLDNYTFLVSQMMNVAETIIRDQFIKQCPLSLELVLIFCMGILSILLTYETRAWMGSISIVAVSGIYVLVAWLLFMEYRYWLPIIMPVGGGLLFTHVCSTSYRVIFEQREQRRVKGIFSKIVSPNVVNELLQAERLSLGGAQRRISIFFADVRGFTEMTDLASARAEDYVRQNNLTGKAAEVYLDQQAQEVLATVNLYLGAVADVIKKHEGTLDKYIGDCVMAFWGAPTPNPKHALSCVQAAIEAQRGIYSLNLARAAENKLREAENVKRAAANQPLLYMHNLLSLGTGINSGLVTVGLMGSDAHILNYTVFGREVNLASRLEGVSGRGRIIIGEATYEDLKRDDPELAARCSPQPPVTVKGIRNAVKIFEVPWKQDNLPPTTSAPIRTTQETLAISIENKKLG